MGAPELIVPGTASGTAPVGGTGTTDTIPMWTAASTLGNSAISQVAGAIQTLTLTNAGAGATNGTYSQQALTGGTGTGSTADIVVAGNVVTVLILRSPGTGYTAGDTLSCATIGGGGFVFTVSSVSASDNASGNVTAVRIGAGTATPRASIDMASGCFIATSTDQTTRQGTTASSFIRQYSTILVQPAEQATVANTAVVGITSSPQIDFSLMASGAQLNGYSCIASPTVTTASQTLTLSGYTTALYRAKSGDISTGSTTVRAFLAQYGVLAGVGAASTTTCIGFQSLPFIDVVGHTIGSFSHFQAGPPTFNSASTITNYYGLRLEAFTGSGTITNRWGVSQEDTRAKNQFLGNTGIGVDPGSGKVIASLTLTNAGTGYTNGTYSQVALTTVTGTGTGATADIVVAGNIVTTVVLRNPGQGYAVSDTLSCASIGAGSNFLVTVATTASILRSDGTVVGSRIGAGTTTPRASLDVRNGALIDGFGQFTHLSAGTGNPIFVGVPIALQVSNQSTALNTLTLGANNFGSRAVNVAYRVDTTAQTASSFNYGVSAICTLAEAGAATATSIGGNFIGNVNTTGLTGRTLQLSGVSGVTSIQAAGGTNTFAAVRAVEALSLMSAAVAQNVTLINAFGASALSIGGAAHAVTTAVGFDLGAFAISAAATVTNFYGLRLAAPTLSGGATITNRWGISQEDTAANNLIAGPIRVGASAGTVPASNTIDVSTAGWGLKLPATPLNGNANTLDSYQEGTRVLAAGDLSGWTYVTATQYWTLVGRTVTLHTVFTGGTSSATGGATIATPPLLTPLRIAAGAAANSSGTALGNGVCVVASTSSTTGTVITSNAISSSAIDKVITVTYETAGL